MIIELDHKRCLWLSSHSEITFYVRLSEEISYSCGN
jgi:hypothetical protein